MLAQVSIWKKNAGPRFELHATIRNWEEEGKNLGKKKSQEEIVVGAGEPQAKGISLEAGRRDEFLREDVSSPRTYKEMEDEGIGACSLTAVTSSPWMTFVIDICG